MKDHTARRGLRQRLSALLIAAATLWCVTLTATAGSLHDAAAALLLGARAPLAVLRWELGDLWGNDGLSPAAVLTLGESALLLSAREEVAALLSAEEGGETPESAPPDAETPVTETPLHAASGVDNGIPARTLIPTTTEGYTVVGTAYISSTRDAPPDLAALSVPYTAKLGDDGPQILILHTHGSECYTPADDSELVLSGNHRSLDCRCNVVRVGDEIAQVLGDAGIPVLHDRTLYDAASYSGAYDRSLTAAENYLKKYPSLRYVLDIHRDAIEDSDGNEYKVIAPTEEGAAAQLSLVVGSDGSGAPHPDWMSNLRFAAALQQQLLGEHPQLMRPILLRKSRYNQHVSPGALLVEAGAAGNSPEEAVLAGRLFAEGLAELLQGGNK